MPAYWISTYRAVTNPEGLARYAALAGPAITAGGGRFLARGTAAAWFEGGLEQRTVLIEFDSVDQALATYHSPAYAEALKHIPGAADRDIRIVAGV